MEPGVVCAEVCHATYQPLALWLLPRSTNEPVVKGGNLGVFTFCKHLMLATSITLFGKYVHLSLWHALVSVLLLAPTYLRTTLINSYRNCPSHIRSILSQSHGIIIRSTGFHIVGHFMIWDKMSTSCISSFVFISM